MQVKIWLWPCPPLSEFSQLALAKRGSWDLVESVAGLNRDAKESVVELMVTYCPGLVNTWQKVNKVWQVKQEEISNVTVIELLLSGPCFRKGLRTWRIKSSCKTLLLHYFIAAIHIVQVLV